MGLGLARYREAFVRRLLGVDLPVELYENAVWRSETEARILRLREDVEATARLVDIQFQAARRIRDDTEAAKIRLEAMRRLPEYAAVFADKEPLVTVRIPSWKKTDELIDVAIASVLAQTWERFEIVVVNDGPNEKTEKAIAGLRDHRIRYLAFPEQSRYPEDQHSRWQVAGAPGMNRGVDEAAGAWIAPLDDDDSFTPDHIEKLVSLAIDQRVELAYGALRSRNAIDGSERLVWSSPPAVNHFSFLGAVYLAMVPLRFDEESWLVNEPGDWNLMRRMIAAGVTMAATEDVVGTINLVPFIAKADV